jgi:pimeloyl-ACP methyl ester carboxylesterase
MKNIVLVHGGFVDGSGWEGVYKILKKDGYNVSIVQNPTISLEGDVAATKRILALQDGPAILVGHSYGGAVITEAGNDPNAFMADSQVPWGVEALSGTISEPAWKAKPSWYLVVTEDKMIPPVAQRAMSKRASSTVVEVKGSHAIYVSQPGAVAALIEQAAKSVKAAA